MGRTKRGADGGFIYHVLNLANPRLLIFEKDADYEALDGRQDANGLASDSMREVWLANTSSTQ